MEWFSEAQVYYYDLFKAKTRQVHMLCLLIDTSRILATNQAICDQQTCTHITFNMAVSGIT